MKNFNKYLTNLYKNIDNQWLSFFLLESKKEYFLNLLNLISQYENRISPSLDDIFNAYKYCDFKKTKVLILGQDPYPGIGVADGLAFSTKSSKTPASLRNIFKELYESTGILRKNNNLLDWAEQGVLLLNTSLTIIDNKINSTYDWPWNDLIVNTINELNQNLDHYVVVLWGNHAATFEKYFDYKKTTIFKSSHPSPLSARKSFFGSNIFSLINEDLQKHNLTKIIWG